MGKTCIKMVFLTVLFFTISSCTKDTDRDGVKDDRDECPEVAAETKDGCPASNEIKQVKIFLETSASMGGYFNPQYSTEYKNIISDLVNKVDQNVKPVKIAFIADSTFRYDKTVSDFSREIATTPIAPQKSSQLHKIIDQISSETGKGIISILVSDCILSFPDDDIKNNREINVIQADVALKNNIFRTFSALNKKHYATSVYAFRSKFFGTYYNYQNGKIPLRSEVRPFYIWVIGESELVSKFNSGLNEISTFKPEKSLHFGLMDEAVTHYDIIPQLGQKGQWARTTGGLKDIEISNTEPLQFFIGLNLRELPAYAQDIQYLQNNIKVSGVGGTVKYQFRDKSSLDKRKLKGQGQIKQFEDASHVLMVEIVHLNINESQLQISLPLKYDMWFKDWSTMDDKSVDGRKNKTFAFEHLIGGVLEAFDTRNKEFINLSINLTKD